MERVPMTVVETDRFLVVQSGAPSEPGADPYEPLRRMIGMGHGAHAEGSIYHDIRPGEEP